MKLWFSLAAIATFGIAVSADSTFSPARPPAVPLAVKSPYMSAWQYAGSDGGNGGYLAGQWAQFWSGQVVGWAGLIKVDDVLYTWMGAPEVSGVFPPSVSQTSFEYTSTRSTFIMNVAGKVEMNVTFLSPLAPTDFKRQSLIFSYLSVDIAALDGALHSVQLYADTSAEWVAGDKSQTAQWSYGVSNGIASHTSWRQTQVEFQETNQQADWGNWYWSTAATSAMTYQSGADTSVRDAFSTNGVLGNTQDTNYRAINNDWPVFGYAFDLGNVGSSVHTLFTLGLCQDNAITFDGVNGIVSLPSLWKSYFATDLDAVEFFYNDWSQTSGAIDSQIAIDSIAAGGQDYLTITSLSARQAFAGIQLVGTIDKPYAFLKEISSDGNTQTVDVIFPTMPIFIYSNPIILKLLLDPLFEQQEAGKWPKTFSIHDLGEYPGALGHEDGNDEEQPLEECGNMIIMTLAYAQRTNDVAYLTQHYALLKQWNQYLIDEALIPANQISTDDFAGPLANQTNLAIKGIIGIQAMSVIAELTGNLNDSVTFDNIAHQYVQQWQTLGIASSDTPPHTELSYGDTSSHGLLYNIYSDKLLGLNLVPQSVFDMQSTFYPTVALEFGVPLDTRHTYTKSDWEMFCAAVASTDTKTMFIQKLATWINSTPTNLPLGDLWDAGTGNYNGPAFTCRPVVGGHFALLALNGAPTTTKRRGRISRR